MLILELGLFLSCDVRFALVVYVVLFIFGFLHVVAWCCLRILRFCFNVV